MGQVTAEKLCQNAIISHDYAQLEKINIFIDCYTVNYQLSLNLKVRCHFGLTGINIYVISQEKSLG